jgi:BetI-type transcriptional repressor, C-terminal
VPKIVDYAGRFAFFELASFTLATGPDAGVRLLLPWIPSVPGQVAEELVWWRLVIAAPTTASLPPDWTGTADGDEDSGPVHHRFAIANHGYIPSDVLNASIEPPRSARSADDELDLVVRAREEHEECLADRLEIVVRTTAPGLAPPAIEHHARVLHAVVDGLGVAVCLGRLRPDEAASLARSHLDELALAAPR